jgi:hypothetical protein
VRTQIDITNKRNKPWLQWSYWPAYNTDMQREDLMLCPLYECETDFRDGRFLFKTSEQFEHVVEMVLKEDDNARKMLLETAFEWIRSTNCKWNMKALSSKPATLLFSFEDSSVAYMFMLNFTWI